MGKLKIYKITRGGGAIGDKLLASLFVHILNDNGIKAILSLSKYINLINCDYAYNSIEDFENAEYIDYQFEYFNKQEDNESIIDIAINRFKEKFNIDKEIINNRMFIPVNFYNEPNIPNFDVVMVTKCGNWAPVREWPYFDQLKHEFNQLGISWIDVSVEDIKDNLFLNYVKKSKVFLTLETGPSHIASQFINKENSLVIQSGYCLNSFWNMYGYDFIYYDVPCKRCFVCKNKLCENGHECMVKISVDDVLQKVLEKLGKYNG